MGLAVLLVLLAAVAAAWYWRRSHDGAAAAGETRAAPQAVRSGTDVLRYPAGAPQLDMIRAEQLGAEPVPLGDALSARMVYDEDVTARIGVGISGRVLNILAAPGDSVTAGQVLAEIDSADVGTAAADVGKAKADEERKRLAVERARGLTVDDAIARRDWEALQSDHAQAQAELARAEQRLRNLNPRNLPINGQRIKLTSPVAGVVTDRSATPALEVSPGMPNPLFTVTDLTRLWVLIDLPESMLAKVRRGAQVRIESDAFPDERFVARLVQLGQTVDVNSRRVTLRAVLENPQRKLLPEMFVRARILQETGEGVRVPNTALVNQGLYSYVFVQSAPGEFRRRKVTLLSQGDQTSFVGAGLVGGEQVVTSGALLLDAEFTARSGGQP